MKRLALGLGAVLLGLLAVILVRTLTVSSHQVTVPAVPAFAFEEGPAVERLAGAIRFRTVFLADGGSQEQFDGLHGFLQRSWPKVHEKLQREQLGDALLFTWQGSDPAAAPVVLLAHQDVVPVENEGQWSHPPWDGEVDGGFVWGRGSLDDKGALCATLEAVQLLLDEGFTPRRTVYLALGHDEEVRGDGARAIVEALGSRGVKPRWVLDEGGAVTDGVIQGPKGRVAVISVAEKGFLSLELTVESEGGHSSMPPPHTAAGLVAAAVTRLEDHPFPASFDGPIGDFFDALAPELPFGQKLALSNRWLLGPLLLTKLSAQPATNAGLRTTTAVTMLAAGVKDNVLPRHATATVNLRIRSGETRESVLARVKAVVADERVKVTAKEGTLSSDPSPVSPVDAEGYRLIERTIRGMFPDTVVLANVANGGTDSRSFTKLTSQVYRFAPGVLKSEDLPRIHGIDERVGTADYAQMVRFYRQLLKDAQAD